VADVDEKEDEEEIACSDAISSSPSELASRSESDKPAPRRKRKAGQPQSAKSLPATRALPKRQAAKNLEIASRSRYFENSEGGDDDEVGKGCIYVQIRNTARKFEVQISWLA
jgi:hypothetical protein